MPDERLGASFSIDISQLQAGLRSANKLIRESQSQFKAAAAEMDNWTKSEAGLTARNQALTAQMGIQQKKVEALKQEYQRLVSEGMDETSDRAIYLRTQINNEEAALKKNEAEVKRNTEAMDKLGDETQDAGDKTKDASEGFTVLKGAIANLASQAIMKAIDGLKQLGSTLIDVGKQSLESYAEYEQLVGGVETLFKDSAKEVQGYADIAYKTAQISANEYMETVTSFSASLLQGLGGDTAQAAKIADMAIIDMSDNANKMGTSMEMIQNAYQGFAKQNYTMLDNLKLGYGGTQAEMARLINDTGVMGKEFKATAKNIKDVPFNKLIEGIHKVQQQMGITGTSAKEASSTIEGSVNAMKASWGNLLTAIADDNADLTKSVDEFVDSAVTAGNNMIPRIKQIVSSAKDLINGIIEDVFPKLKREIPELRPLIEVFEWFVDNKGIVIKAVGAIMAAFAVSKVIDFTKSMSDGTKAIIDFAKQTGIATIATNARTAAQAGQTAAEVAGTAATSTLTVATNALNAAWAANPIGIVVAALGALIGVIALVKKGTEQLTEAEKEQQRAFEEQHDRLEANTEAWNDLTEAQQENINVGMTETAHLQALWGELQNIVDQNGKVKDGYEKRASFIADTLSEELGVEIELNGQIIQGYKDIQKEIDNTIEKKKAQILLDSQEELYAEAMKKKSEAYRDVQIAEKEYTEQKKELTRLNGELEELQRGDIDRTTALQIALTQRRIDKQQKEVDESAKNYKEQKNLLDEYVYNIGTYEENLALFHDNQFGKMRTATWQLVDELGSAGEAEKAMSEQRIKELEWFLADYQAKYEATGDSVYQNLINTAEQELQSERDKLAQYQNITDEGLGNVAVLWNDNLDDTLSAITGKNIKFKDAGEGMVQAVVDGEAVGAPKSKAEMAKMVDDTVTELAKKSPEFKTSGENFVNGVKEGINNQDTQSSVFNSIASFGKNLLSKFKKSLEEKSPSKATKEMGIFLLKGLEQGVAAETKNATNQIEDFSKNMLKLFEKRTDSFSKEGKNLMSAYSSGMSNALKETEDSVKRTIDNYFDDLISENNKKQAELKKQQEKDLAAIDKNDKDKRKKVKAAYQAELDDLKQQNTDLKNLYKDFGKTAISEFNKVMEAEAKGINDELTAQISSLSAAMDSEIAAVESKIENMRSKMAGYGSLFTTSTDEAGNEVVSLDNIKKQTKAIKQYYENLNTLSHYMSDDWYAEVEQMGVDDALKYTNELLKLNEDELIEYSEAYDKKQKTAKKLSDRWYANDIESIKGDYLEQMESEFSAAQKKIASLGKDTMKGFIKGMSYKDFNKDIQKVAKKIIKQMKKELKISSPSKVFADQIGKFAALGVIQGFEKNIAGLSDSMLLAAGDISSAVGNSSAAGKNSNGVIVYQTNNYSQAHSRYEIYKSKQQTAAAVRLALGTV